MVRKAKRMRQLAQLKVRLPEPLRRDLERAAAYAGHSMNAEIVKRLTESFHQFDKTKLVAHALLRDLDDGVLEEMVEKYTRDQYESSRAHDDDGEPR